MLVNTNLPFAEEPSPALADADEASGIQLEAEAAAAYQKWLRLRPRTALHWC